MKLIIASISPRRRGKSGPAEALAEEYVGRCGRLCETEIGVFATEAALVEVVGRIPGRSAGVLVLFDSRGEPMTSAAFAGMLGRLRDEGSQRVIFGIGPADGWSKEALGRAAKVVSLGRMTLPHELARVVVAEQVYRALTILAGHPYHCGH